VTLQQAVASFILIIFEGLFWIIPCVDTFRKVDLRTVSFEIPPQEVSEYL